MKYLFASDVHGSSVFAEKLVDELEKTGAEKLILCGDILYHGPSFLFADEIDSMTVCDIFNQYSDRITGVLGNCDFEEDLEDLDFPISRDFLKMVLNGIPFFITHGHIYAPDYLPQDLPAGSAFVSGHTHVPRAERSRNVFILNPGSTTFPKGGYPGSYGLLDGNEFSVLDFDGNILKQIRIMN